MLLLHLVALHVAGVLSKATEINYETILFERMDNTLEFFNRAIANLEWQALNNDSVLSPEMYTYVFQMKLKWRNRWCAELVNFQDSGVSLNWKLLRFLCNGPKYSNSIIRNITLIKELMSSIYESAQICKVENHKRRCYNGELDVEKLMATSRNEEELRWAWLAWRNHMSRMRQLFAQLVNHQNTAVQSNGYADIGEYWREEFDIPNLENVFEEMYRRVEPLYRLLHAVVRFRVAKLYPDIVDTHRPIPAHLLGSLCSQNWEPLIDVIFPNYTTIVPNLTDSMKRNNYSVVKMIKEAEHFYISLGFLPLTLDFWKNSVFEREANRKSSCHATAVNMYKKDDYRIFACLETKPQDFDVLYHELGHIQYYMAYRNQPSFFKSGVNSAFHESVGDAVSYGATSLRHLQRLRLIPDPLPRDIPRDLLEIAILLRQALFKIPLLFNGLIIEKWRWSVFSGRIKPSRYSAEWWKLHRRYMGVAPPSPRSEEFFDPAAKFHISHDIPYARYYLASFLQVQLFQGMCEASMGLKVGSSVRIPPLHECDIYGSKDATRILRSVMELGSSVDWRHALRLITGHDEYRVEPFLAYYEPVRNWLLSEIKYHKIPVGWDD